MIPSLSIILVRPQLGENIGRASRAMGNFGASDLRLVSPRDPWPNSAALAASVGAREIIERARVFESLAGAVQNLDWVFCTTARLRDIKKEVYNLREGAHVANALSAKKIGIVFGPEQAGLTNEEVSLCNGAISIPTSPGSSSLNLSHAVLLCVYEFSGLLKKPNKTQEQAKQGEVLSFLSFLEERLESKSFFLPAEKKEKMKQNLRDIFLRRPISSNDINTLFGAVKCLGQGGDISLF